MTKKDYELIAKAIKLTSGTIKAFNDSDTPYKYDAEGTLELLTVIFSEFLEKENPRFQRPLFLTACGLKTEEVNA
jgi:hypothetical protein